MSENQNKLDELLDEYFDLAFEQGREFACNGVKANRVRKEILGLFQQEPVKQESKPLADFKQHLRELDDSIDLDSK